MKFLEKIITDLLDRYADLGTLDVVLPGKRPIIFIKKILQQKNYSGFLPNFFTIDELIVQLSGKHRVQGIVLWLFAFEVYRERHPEEELSQFLKWFPTMLKDWDDILKFSDKPEAVLEFMFDEERIKNWSENLNDTEDGPRHRFLHFWQKMHAFLPVLQKRLEEKNWATAGMVHKAAATRLQEFALQTSREFVFCGFNALTPVEEKLVRELLQQDKCHCYFQADEYYLADERQEAGKFLRSYARWKEFHDNRPFTWVENDFEKPKDISVYEVSGNVSQCQVLPEILLTLPPEELSQTAVVLLDENLLPAALEALRAVKQLNITMGFPLRSLGFSNAIRKLFYLQKQLEKKKSSYYYSDILAVLEELPKNAEDAYLIKIFKAYIEERNIVYISQKLLEEYLSGLSYFILLQHPSSALAYLTQLSDYCFRLKFGDLDDIQYENVSVFEEAFKTLYTQLKPYRFPVTLETLEVLINQLVNSETVDFRGEPVAGLQVMGLLETRLLNFKNVIMLSVNEGKLPLGNSQNTYLPFDVRKNFALHTFFENDSIYAYHFYRLLQHTEKVHLLYNALASGINTGEKSRFITQLEIEDEHHQIRHLIVENPSPPLEKEMITIEKTPAVLEKLAAWKMRVSASHLNSFVYNPIDFYLSKILNAGESAEIEEELSQRTYGSLVHYALQYIYQNFIGRTVGEADLTLTAEEISAAVDKGVAELKHSPELYERGMNFVHRSIAQRTVTNILEFDRKLVAEGNTLEIVDVEQQFKDLQFYLDEERQDSVFFYGYIDRVDRLNGQLRVIDYKTGKTNNLRIKLPKADSDPEKMRKLFFNSSYKQAMQLSLYAYAILHGKNPPASVECGIWSFGQINQGVQPLDICGATSLTASDLDLPEAALRDLIAEILNPKTAFVENEPAYSAP